jgi:type I restriction enzyme S subunit
MKTEIGKRYKKYTSYKGSGVEWLGEIPEHWEVTPIRLLARSGYKTFTDGDWIESPFIRDGGIRLIQTGNIGIGVYKEQGFRYIDEETFRLLNCTEVIAGDVLICRLADPVGRACLAPNLGCRMITSVDVCILKTSIDVVPAFTVYALSGIEYLAWLGGICRGGTRDRVSRSMLGTIRVQQPPFSEQRAIAVFLDRESIKIDALVTKKERLVELLQEKRTALITRAVTKGLDPNVPMKDSGVKWLGEIPAHWNVVLLKRIASIKYGLGEPPKQLVNGIPFIRATNITQGRIIEHEMLFLDPKDVPWNRDPVLQNGDIVVVRSGAYTGDSAIITTEYKGAIAGYDMVVRPGQRLISNFLAWALLSQYVLESQIKLQSLRAAQPHLNAEELGTIILLLPSRVEQLQIDTFL